MMKDEMNLVRCHPQRVGLASYSETAPDMLVSSIGFFTARLHPSRLRSAKS